MNSSGNGILWLLLLCSWAWYSRATWQENLPPRRYVTLDLGKTTSFRSNHTDGDFFRMLQKTEDFIIIGARDAAFNLSLPDLRPIRTLTWSSNASKVELCRLKGKPLNQCQNYIRVLVNTSSNDLLVCGTNAFSPRCRRYRPTGRTYTRLTDVEEQGAGLCPHSPIHNSTATYIDGQLYVGTAADFSGQDALILRDRLRTDKYDTIALDDPHFVNSFALGEHVYFFLREKAVEFINCGKRVYSRVARVCRRDTGGPNRFRRKWTSYVKSRLNCSVAGEFPFYFDELQATSDVISSGSGHQRDSIVYGVFSTGPNSIGGSAVCAFKLQSVLDAFAGPFKERASLNANWLPVSPNKVPQPRPGQCVNNSKTLPDATLNFVKTNPLMDEAVPAMVGGPLLTRIGTSYRFSAVAVDARVRAVGVDPELYVDVIFLGTDNGRVIKLFNREERKASSVVIEEIQALADGSPIRGLYVGGSGERRLTVISDREVLTVPLHRCYPDRITICSECVALQDPYCAWDQRRMRCSHLTVTSYSRSDLVQSILDGVSPRCPQRPGVNTALRLPVQQDEFGGEQPLLFQSEVGLGRHDRPQPGFNGHGSIGSRRPPAEAVFSAETLAVAVASTAILALLVGFVAGHCCARRCRKDDVNLPYADTDYTYFDQRQGAGTRLNHEPGPGGGGGGGEEVTYSEPVLIPTNSMVSTLKKSHQEASSIPMQYTECRDAPPLALSLTIAPRLADCRDGPPLSLRGDPYGTHRQLRSRAPPSADPGLGESHLVHRRESPGCQETPVGDAYATTRSIRRVYL